MFSKFGPDSSPPPKGKTWRCPHCRAHGNRGIYTTRNKTVMFYHFVNKHPHKLRGQSARQIFAKSRLYNKFLANVAEEEEEDDEEEQKNTSGALDPQSLQQQQLKQQGSSSVHAAVPLGEHKQTTDAKAEAGQPGMNKHRMIVIFGDRPAIVEAAIQSATSMEIGNIGPLKFDNSGFDQLLLQQQQEDEHHSKENGDLVGGLIEDVGGPGDMLLLHNYNDSNLFDLLDGDNSVHV